MLRRLAAIVPKVTDLPGNLSRHQPARLIFILVEQLVRLRRAVHIAHASSLRLRSARAHFVRRPLGLASSVLRRGVQHGGCCRLESGLFYFAHASSLRLRSAGAHLVRRAVALALALRASEAFNTNVLPARKSPPFVILGLVLRNQAVLCSGPSGQARG